MKYNTAVDDILPVGQLEDLEERLGSHLVWRIGKSETEDAVVVRMGFASAAAEFANLPRLLNISDEDIERLKQEGKIKVEWVR